MSAQIPTILWDTCVLISWIKGIPEDQEEIDAAENVLRHEEKKLCRLIFSTLIYPEVRKTSEDMPPDTDEILGQFFRDIARRPVIAVDTTIARKAQEIRNKTKLETPDAVMVATAIVSGASALHTFDKEILQLSEKPEAQGIAITKCDLPKLPEQADLIDPSGQS